MSPGRARGRLPRGRAPSILITAGAVASIVAFAFCVIASAYRWHPAVTGPGAVVSVIAMVAFILAAHLRGDDQ
jgi:peptidoglycan/LPS O-acetylase OafA/YrhL